MSEKVQIDIQDEAEKDQVAQQAGTEAHSPKSEAGSEKIVETPTQEELIIKLQAAEEQAQAHYDRLLRVSAESENHKKRMAREMRDVVKFANERLIKELLAVVDNLERAIASAVEQGDPDHPLVHGVSLTLDEIMKIFERHHVKPIEALGAPFDPTYHQAMMQEETDDQPANTVVREMQKGYMIHDRLLRPSMVAVSKTRDRKTDNSDEF